MIHGLRTRATRTPGAIHLHFCVDEALELLFGHDGRLLDEACLLHFLAQVQGLRTKQESVQVAERTSECPQGLHMYRRQGNVSKLSREFVEQ